MTTVNPYVILGAGQSGAWVARTLRSEGFEGDIMLFGDEPHKPYERPPLSKAILLGKASIDDLMIMTGDDFDEMSIQLKLDTRVQTIDPYSKTLTLDNDNTIPYEKLFLCNGGRARTLDIDEALTDRVFTLRNYHDALALRDVLKPDVRIGIIGGGWIGLEAAASAQELGCDVSLFEGSDQLCPRSLPKNMAKWLREYHEAKGVKISCGTFLKNISQSSDGSIKLTLATGTISKVDYLLVAIGMQPNDEIAREAGLDCSKGVIVNTACQTSAPDIFAAGDITALQSPRYTRCIGLESWQNAQDQAIAAAKSALGQNICYDPVPKVWSQQYELMIKFSGDITSSAEIAARQYEDGYLCVGISEAGTALGAATINRMRDHRSLSKAVENNAQVDALKLNDPKCPLTDAFSL